MNVGCANVLTDVDVGVVIAFKVLRCSFGNEKVL